MTMRKAKYMMYVPLVVIGLISLVPFFMASTQLVYGFL